ncbi:hypothetical protein CWI38_0235p0040 [Hamiltosporidium tvaerminnensis]|uniref:Peptidase M48 domain-containing protein n=1 Tax=Hamiltosporidium tvaerminnensis TaxID=1176355 RepID=A0A4Q9M1S7_9MICR|nr:hypothetical protein CWI38_0235p0040 [Hamiltosporidium tvaerminnensis]
MNPFPDTTLLYILSQSYGQDFFDYQKIAIKLNFLTVSYEMTNLLLSFAISAFFLSNFFIDFILNCGEKLFQKSNKKDIFGLPIKEIFLIFVLYIFICFKFLIIFIIRYITGNLFSETATEYLFEEINIFYFFFPLLMAIGVLIPKKFHKILIICYFVIPLGFNIHDMIKKNDVNLNIFEKVDIEKLEKTLKDTVNKYNLNGKIYQEKNDTGLPNGKTCGHFNKYIIFLYGRDPEDTSKICHGILAHEIGHVEDVSCLKKNCFNIFTTLVECSVALLTYTNILPLYSDKISEFTAFSILSLIYIQTLHQIIETSHNLVARRTEVNADKFAKNLGYGENVIKELFYLEHKSCLYPWNSNLYCLLKKVHPSLYSRQKWLLD